MYCAHHSPQDVAMDNPQTIGVDIMSETKLSVDREIHLSGLRDAVSVKSGIDHAATRRARLKFDLIVLLTVTLLCELFSHGDELSLKHPLWVDFISFMVS